MGFGFHIHNFGCRAARADGEAIAARLAASAHRAEELSVSDVVVVNTCTVTAEADRQARAFIRRTARLNPAAKIVVTGCYAQRAPAEVAAMTGVAAVVGNSHKALAPEIILDVANRTARRTSVPDSWVSLESLLAPQPPAASQSVTIHADNDFAHTFIEEAQLVPGAQTRPNLKIQEGCGNRCTFCVIPFTRGPSRSLAFQSIMRQVEGFTAAGGKELVLSGINLGRWGRELSTKDSLPSLVRHILAQTALPRLRLSSIEPMDWTADLIALMAEFAGPQCGEPRLARHAHLPLQSGSDAVLRRMHRRYRPWHYAEKAAALFRAAGPELTFGADVMVGFPGETDAEFDETLEFIRALPFGYLHLFPFSPRPGTRGWSLHHSLPVAPEIVQQRMAVLRALAFEKAQAHRAAMVGRVLPAITLHTPDQLAARGYTESLTDNFLPVELSGIYPPNQLVRVKAVRLTAEGALAAELAGAAESVPEASASWA